MNEVVCAYCGATFIPDADERLCDEQGNDGTGPWYCTEGESRGDDTLAYLVGPYEDVTDEDRAAARRILGIKPERSEDRPAKRHRALRGPALRPATREEPRTLTSVTIIGSGGVAYHVEHRVDTVKGGTYWYCPCRGWIASKPRLDGKKHCKHTDAASSQF